mgnify:CR=1 FL=1
MRKEKIPCGITSRQPFLLSPFSFNPTSWSFPPSHLGNSSELDCTRFGVGYLLSAVATSTATATVAPTIGLLPMPRKPIISTWAGTDEEPANWASECIRPIVSVILWECGLQMPLGPIFLKVVANKAQNQTVIKYARIGQVNISLIIIIA